MGVNGLSCPRSSSLAPERISFRFGSSRACGPKVPTTRPRGPRQPGAAGDGEPSSAVEQEENPTQRHDDEDDGHEPNLAAPGERRFATFSLTRRLRRGGLVPGGASTKCKKTPTV